MSFWRVELSEEGGIFTAEPCESAGTNGRRVIYVEAESKALACSAALQWFESYRARQRKSSEKTRKKAIAKGLCSVCRKNKSRPGKINCQGCAAKIALRERQIKQGDRTVRVPRSLAEVRDAELRDVDASAFRRARLTVSLVSVLQRFDSCSPEEFRAWLVQEIDRVRSVVSARIERRKQPIPQAAE